MNNYQLIIIGSGPGGYAAALKAAGLGLRTAVIEKDEPGGTCVNRGCIPTKALLHVSGIYSSALSSDALGLGLGALRAPDLRRIHSYKDGITSKLSLGVRDAIKKAGADFIEGTAVIERPHEVRVSGSSHLQDPSEESPGTLLTADNILIASGSVPFVPDVPGIGLPGVMTSDDILKSRDRLFESLAIVGGGVIGVELAVFYSEMGVSVSIIEGLDRLLPAMDRELGQNLALIFKKKGIRVYTGTMLKRIETAAGGLAVTGECRGKETAITAEACLCAIGRRPYTSGLFAKGLIPRMDGPRIWTDESFKTSMEGIYAIGDVSGRIQLAHAASAQGEAAVMAMAGTYASSGNPLPGAVGPGTVRLDLVPSCIYCRPEIASVGLTEAEAKKSGIKVKVGKSVMFSNARTMIEDPGRCFMKLVADAGTGELLGGSLMCPDASDMISEITVAIASHLTAADMLRAMRPHPTFEEAMQDALRSLSMK